MVANVNQPLNVGELSKLEEYLGKRPKPVTAIQAQGFLYCIVCAPKIVSLAEWLPLLLGAEPLFVDKVEAKEMVSYFGRLTFQIKVALESAIPFCPLVTSRDALGDLSALRDVEQARAWATGFMQGLKFDKAYWFSQDPQLSKLLQNFFVLVEDDETLVNRLGQDAIDLGVDGLRKKAILKIPVVVKKLHAFKSKATPKRGDKPAK